MLLTNSGLLASDEVFHLFVVQESENGTVKHFHKVALTNCDLSVPDQIGKGAAYAVSTISMN